MKVVYWIKLKNIEQVNSNQSILVNLNRVVHIVIGNSIDCVKVVFSIKVGIISIHDHNHFIGVGSRFLGINYEYPIEAVGDMFFERLHMTVIGKDTEWFSCKLIGKFTSRCNSFKYTIHLRPVD